MKQKIIIFTSGLKGTLPSHVLVNFSAPKDGSITHNMKKFDVLLSFFCKSKLIKFIIEWFQYSWISPNLVVTKLLSLWFINDDDSVCLGTISTVRNFTFKRSIVLYNKEEKTIT